VPTAKATGTTASAVLRELEADPGGFALTARQAALTGPGGTAAGDGWPVGTGQRRVILVVDQVEQLFTQCGSEEERLAFITALTAAATAADDRHPPAALVVLLVRADFEARLTDYAPLAAPVQDRYLLTAMTERQLRMAITQPAVTAGSTVDAELVQVLLDELHTRPGPLILPVHGSLIRLLAVTPIGRGRL
jgi:conflict system STAND superfamily ATPase